MNIYDKSLEQRNMDDGLGYAFIVMFLMFVLYSFKDVVEASQFFESLFIERMIYIPVLTVVLVVTWRYSRKSF